MTLQERTTGREKRISIYDRFPNLGEIPKDAFPKHVLIIPDGNGRFSANVDEMPLFGHQLGSKVILTVIRDLRQLPIDGVSLWGFSANNWARPESEVKGLMQLFEGYARNQDLQDELMDDNVRFVHLGRKDRIPESLRDALTQLEEMTGNNSGKFLSLLIDFGGQDQMRRMLEAVRQNPPSVPITEEMMTQFQDGRGLVPPADLVIRTSGEQRMSGLGWIGDGANTEFYSIPKLLPQTSTEDYIEAIIDFTKRQRRFGGRPQGQQVVFTKE